MYQKTKDVNLSEVLWFPLVIPRVFRGFFVFVASTVSLIGQVRFMLDYSISYTDLLENYSHSYLLQVFRCFSKITYVRNMKLVPEKLS